MIKFSKSSRVESGKASFDLRDSISFKARFLALRFALLKALAAFFSSGERDELLPTEELGFSVPPEADEAFGPKRFWGLFSVIPLFLAIRQSQASCVW